MFGKERNRDMKIISEKKLPNGDSEFECDFTKEEVNILLSYAVNRILKDIIEQEKTIE
jgi:hypothetical protein